MSAQAILMSTETKDWLAEAGALADAFKLKAAEHDESDAFVAENFAALKRAGFFSAHVPAELGGGGVSHREMCALIRRLAHGCGSTALAFSMHTHLVSLAAWRWRNEGAPTDALLKRVAGEGLTLVSSGGSDWLKSAGTATKIEGGFRINAKKVFSSGSPAGDILMTSAVYDDPQAGPTVLHFGVSFKAEGVTILPTWRAMGMRGTGSNDIELKDVFVADAAISGKRPQGKWHHLFHMISMLAFPIIYSAYLGVAEAAKTQAIGIAAKKADETTAYLAGEMETTFAGAEMALEDMMRLAESAKPGPATTNRTFMGRTLAGQGAIRTVERAMEVAGGASFYRATGLERAFRDVQGARFHPLTEKAQARMAGRMALGLDIDG